MPSACDPQIEDIEDMLSAGDPTPYERQSARKSIIPRARKKKELLDKEELQADRYCFLTICRKINAYTVPSDTDEDNSITP